MLKPEQDPLRSVQRELAAAPDAQMLQIVQMVDGMAVRGPADDLVEALRPRLRVLRPQRRMRVGRLLFLPADRLIVDGAQVEPGTWRVPRAALPDLGAAICAALPDAAQSVQEALDRTRDPDEVVRQGDRLWPSAADVLRGMRPPAGLAERMPEASFAELAQGLAGLLASGGELVRLQMRGAPAIPQRLLQTLLERAGERDGAGRAMLLALLLQIMPGCPEVRRLLADAARRPAGAGRAVIESQIRDLERAGGIPEMPLAEASVELGRRAAMLDTLQSELADLPQKRRVAAARARLHAASGQRFGRAVEETLAAPLREPGAITDAALAGIEANARSLRLFASAAAPLGDPAAFDGALGSAMTAVKAAPMPRVDRARLVEILAGPKQALEFFRQG
jgi:hypothetical protein